MSSVLSIAVTLFLVANPIGNSPALVALVKDFEFQRQKWIMFREAMIGLIIALVFQYIGQLFLDQLQLQIYTLRIAGGILLLICAINMIFAPKQNPETLKTLKTEPMIVPIATPLITGPGLLTIIMFYSKQEPNLTLTLAILLTWVGVTSVLLAAPYLQKILGTRGLAALEQLMGLFLALMAVGMLAQGSAEFIRAIKVN